MIELKLIKSFPHEVIALDEVGRSPLAGPVVIGAVRLIVPDEKSLVSLVRFLKRKGVKDSKVLSSKKRLSILETLQINDSPYRLKTSIPIQKLQLDYVIWEMNHEVIDELNILKASMFGMKEAALLLSEMKNESTTLLIDGHLKLPWDSEPPSWNEVPIVSGDKKSALIALASIIAKEKRDAWMKEMHEIYPQYGFDSNVGYPTKSHREAIKTHGPCPIHRKSFAKVKEFVGTSE